VDDATVASFLRLIREVGRQDYFVDFLICLCRSRGKGVRTNQWRICRMLVTEAPELLLRLSHRESAGGGEKQIVVSAEPAFFPAFSQQASSEMELSEWLEATSDETRRYFQRCITLLGALCSGRNLKNSPLVRQLLPYDLVFAVIASSGLLQKRLEVCIQFVGIARDLYVDAEPFEEMVYLKTVRIWENVPAAAKSGQLASRLTTVLDIEWGQFDGLKAFILQYISKFFSQTATMVSQNTMVLQLLQVLYHLIRGGFYRAPELLQLREPLLKGNRCRLAPNTVCCQPIDLNLQQW